MTSRLSYTGSAAPTEPAIDAVRITTRRLCLRELRRSDAPAIETWESDPEVVRFLHHGLRSPEQTEAALENSLMAAQRVPRLIYDLGLERASDGSLLGSCGLELKLACRQEPRVYEASLWYLLGRAAWGRGYASEACQALLQFGFAHLQLQRVYIEVDPKNSASVAVARRLGLRQEAHFLQNFWFKGAWCDTLVFARLAGET